MAGVAGESAGVIGCDNLREFFRLGAVGFVAAGTDHRAVGKNRLHRSGIVGVRALSTVAGLAGNVRVTAKFLLVDDVGVTAFADFMSSETWRPGSGLGDRVAPIVPVLAKAPGDDCGAKHDEQKKRQQHHSTKADEMFDVLEQSCLSEPDWESCSGALRHVI